MISVVLTRLIIAWGALSCIYMLRCAWSRFPQREIDDVVHFLYPVDLALAESLLDPATDFTLRWKAGPRAFRDAQRRRMRLYLELVHRMSHNSKVLVEFGNMVINRKDRRSAELASELQRKAIEVRLYCLLTLVRLRFWLLVRRDALRFVPAPALAQLRIAGDLDGPKTYDALKTAAAAAFVQLQPAELEALTRNL